MSDVQYVMYLRQWDERGLGRTVEGQSLENLKARFGIEAGALDEDYGVHRLSPAGDLDDPCFVLKMDCDTAFRLLREAPDHFEGPRADPLIGLRYKNVSPI